MSLHPDRVRWNRHYSDPRFIPDWAPDLALARHLPELPRGRALDLGCGVGANALFLAKRGYRVDAVDVSDAALEHLRRASVSEGLNGISMYQAALESFAPLQGAYDLILCVRCPEELASVPLASALRPGGVLLCHQLGADDLPAPGGWPQRFPELEVLSYEADTSGLTFLGRRPRGPGPAETEASPHRLR